MITSGDGNYEEPEEIEDADVVCRDYRNHQSVAAYNHGQVVPLV